VRSGSTFLLGLAGVSGIVLGLLHVTDALGDWFFQNVTF
jgi:hypothetical protein